MIVKYRVKKFSGGNLKAPKYYPEHKGWWFWLNWIDEDYNIICFDSENSAISYITNHRAKKLKEPVEEVVWLSQHDSENNLFNRIIDHIGTEGIIICVAIIMVLTYVVVKTHVT